MICNHCGKSNEIGLRKCANCGAEMPSISDGGGFADILRYNSPKDSNTSHTFTETQGHTDKNKSDIAFDLTMQKLIKRADGIVKLTQKNFMFGLIGIAISFFILVSSIITCIITISNLKSQKNEMMSQITEINQELKEHKKEIDTFISKIENDNENNSFSENESFNDSESDEQINNESIIYDENHSQVKNPSVSSNGNRR